MFEYIDLSELYAKLQNSNVKLWEPIQFEGQKSATTLSFLEP